MTADPLPLVVTGTVSLDTLHLPSGVHESVLGGSALFGAMGAALVRPCSVIGTVGRDVTPASLLLLERHGVDLGGLAHERGPTFRWAARYSADLSERHTLDRSPGVGQVAPGVPSRLCGVGAWAFLGSMDPRMQRSVVEQLGSGARYGVDTMSHWIEEHPDDLLALMKGADTVFVSEDEVALLARAADASEAARFLMGHGTRYVVVKAGERGVDVYGPDGSHAHCPALAVDSLVDPTGAGDSLGGAFMASRSRGDRVGRALACGAAAASFAIEGVSFGGFRGTRDGAFDRRVKTASAAVEAREETS